MIKSPPPVQIREIFKLTNLGIDPKFFKFNITSLLSERYVCIKDTDQNGTPQLTIVELFNKMNAVKRPANNVDAAIMHINKNILALKAPFRYNEHILQIFDLDIKTKLKNIQFAENIVFWTWVNEKILAIVTTTSVYHVSIDNETDKKVKISERNGELRQAQIIGYVLSDDKKWSALFGISTPDNGKTINGHIQLYFIDGRKQQLISGHACIFGMAYIHNEKHRSNIFCYVERGAGETSSFVHIVEISPVPQGFQKHKLKTEIFYDKSFPNDFPISLIVSEKYGILYIITKYGFLYIYQLVTNKQIFRTQISNQTVFVAAKNYSNDGFLAINKDGSLIGCMIDKEGILPFLSGQKIEQRIYEQENEQKQQKIEINLIEFQVSLIKIKEKEEEKEIKKEENVVKEVNLYEILSANGIGDITMQILKSQEIKSFQELKYIKDEDLKALGIKLGEIARIRKIN